MAYDVDAVRRCFPGLNREQDGQPAVFFDNPAGTQMAQRSIDRMVWAMTSCNANLGGHFQTSLEAQRLVDDAREAARDFVNAQDAAEIVFGQNMTTLTFMMSRTLGRDFEPGDEIVVTRMDHDGNVTPWVTLAEDKGLTIRWLDFDPETFEFDLTALDRVMTGRTRLVAVNYASNVTGTINDVKTVAKAAKAVGALVYVDAVQFAPHGVIDVQDIGCDFLVCSSYKFYGPHHGVMWGRREILERLTAYKVRAANNELPTKFETGTASREALAGVMGAIEHYDWVGRQFGDPAGSRRERIVAGVHAMQRHDQQLAARLIDGLEQVPNLRIMGITDRSRLDRRVPTVSFVIDDTDPAEIAKYMASQGIYVWDGHNYGVEPVDRLGLLDKGGVVRVGPTHYNSPAEIDRFLDALDAYLQIRRPGGRAR
ncbi:MAG: cysteine desulfurase-like protein [Alphaproteobacteria bacterium]|nr:MAG: cysteine desulfurase-like protein [Alphaproteobacteria bacterium]